MVPEEGNLDHNWRPYNMEWVEVGVEWVVAVAVALVQEAVVLQIARSVELCHIWAEVCF